LVGTKAPAPASVPAVTTVVRPPPPVVGEVERLLKEGKVAEALIRGYLTAEADVRQAFGLQLPRQWTHREFLREHLRPDMGYVAVLLPRLYALYEPARYGSSRPISADAVRDLVRAIYNEGPVYNLYRDVSGAFRLPRPGTPSGAGARPPPVSNPKASGNPPPVE
jgi:hypothetical protein